MVSKRAKNITGAAKQLKSAIAAYESATRTAEKELFYLALIKAAEVLVEYCWKEMKARVEDAGLEAASPKEAVRQAATIRLISDPEKWIKIIIARNLSLHDYFGISEAEYVNLAKDLSNLATELA